MAKLEISELWFNVKYMDKQDLVFFYE